MLLTRMNLLSVEIKTKTVIITRNLVSFHPKETQALEIYPCRFFFFKKNFVVRVTTVAVIIMQNTSLDV